MEASDDESNDSFFETTKALKKKSSKENMTKNVKKASIFDDDDDFMADLGFNPKQPKETKKSGFLDDLLATASAAPASKTISRQSTETTDYSVPQTRPKTSSGRPPSAGKQSSEKTVNDPLDLFSIKPKKKEQSPVPPPVPQAKPKPLSGPADWLGLTTSTKEEDIDVKETKAVAAPSKIEYSDSIEKTRAATPVKFMDVVNDPKIEPHPAVQLASTNLQIVNAIHTAQQQESQLAVAEQLKNQEQTLMDLNKRQQELLMKQEVQFNDLVQKQVTRQMQLENSIKAQQERISAHIQLLMTQPAISYPISEKVESMSKNKEPVQEEDLSQEEQITLTAEVKKLELEKLRLEDALSNASALHEKEIQIIETAYK